MRIGRRKNLALIGVLMLFAGADIIAIASRMEQVVTSPVSWLKISVALVMQAAILAGVYGYLAWLQGGPRLELPPYGALESWRSRLVPIFILIVVGGFSANLFYNGVVCGAQAMPTGRGVALCR